MSFIDKTYLKHTGAPDSEVDPHILERLDGGCQWVAALIEKMGPPPPPETSWLAWETRPASALDADKAMTFEMDYDVLMEDSLFVQAPSGQLMRLCLFNGGPLLAWMRANNMVEMADYIDETRSGCRLVVFEIGIPRGCYVRAMAALPMQRGGMA
jgi:hypothetical protein